MSGEITIAGRRMLDRLAARLRHDPDGPTYGWALDELITAAAPYMGGDAWATELDRMCDEHGEARAERAQRQRTAARAAERTDR